MLELELKARVDDIIALKQRMEEAGARLQFIGRTVDLRFDEPSARLTTADEVLRLRQWIGDDGVSFEVIGWKGPTHVVDGLKARSEHEARLVSGESATAILTALGYQMRDRIDRRIVVWQLAGVTARLEEYPEMDALIEVEGAPDEIERVVAVTGIARDRFSADPLPHFAAAYERRTGRRARLTL